MLPGYCTIQRFKVRTHSIAYDFTFREHILALPFSGGAKLLHHSARHGAYWQYCSHLIKLHRWWLKLPLVTG